MVSGLIVGVLAHLIGRFVYLMILFPVLMGLAGRFTLESSVVLGKCRHLAIVIVLGLLTVATIYGSMHYFDYLMFRHNIKTHRFALSILKVSSPDEDDPDVLIDDMLIRETGTAGVIGYLKLKTRDGISITRLPQDSSNIGMVGARIYLGLELLTILGLTLSGMGIIRKPFCDPCNRWYVETPLTPTAWNSVGAIQAAVEESHFTSVGKALEKPAAMPMGLLSSARCPRCEISEPVLYIHRVNQKRRGKKATKKVFSSFVPFDGHQQIIAGVEIFKARHE